MEHYGIRTGKSKSLKKYENKKYNQSEAYQSQASVVIYSNSNHNEATIRSTYDNAYFPFLLVKFNEQSFPSLLLREGTHSLPFHGISECFLFNSKIVLHLNRKRSRPFQKRLKCVSFLFFGTVKKGFYQDQITFLDVLLENTQEQFLRAHKRVPDNPTALL